MGMAWISYLVPHFMTHLEREREGYVYIHGPSWGGWLEACPRLAHLVIRPKMSGIFHPRA